MWVLVFSGLNDTLAAAGSKEDEFVGGVIFVYCILEMVGNIKEVLGIR